MYLGQLLMAGTTLPVVVTAAGIPLTATACFPNNP